MKQFLSVCILFFAVAAARSQLTLHTGDSIVLRFDSLPQIVSPADGFGTLPVGGAEFVLSDFDVAEDVLRVQFFEDKLSDGPMADVVAEQANDGTLGPPSTAWADFQGLVRFTMVAGSVTLEQVTFFHQIPIDALTGERHQLVVTPQWGTNLIHQLVPCAGPAAGGTWKNHGQHVSTMSKTSRQLVRDGLLTQRERSRIVSAAARSNCGKKSRP